MRRDWRGCAWGFRVADDAATVVATVTVVVTVTATVAATVKKE